jgi:hypothetical protein
LQANVKDNGSYESTHTASADGWFWLAWECNGTKDYVQMRNITKQYSYQTPDGGRLGYQSFILPVAKNDICRIYYLQSPGSNTQLRFIYAEGVK